MFGPLIEHKILQYARYKSPNEICGYIDSAENFIPLPNMSDNPQQSFLIGHLPFDAIAVIHSHPGGPFAPSEDDMRQQIASDLPWGIAAFDDEQEHMFWFGDGAPTVPLLDRGFRHGVTDCYALTRDFYKQIHNIELPEFPREWEWWNNDKELFTRGYKNAGFSPVDMADILPADVILFTVRSTTPNHSAVYLGRDLILHHTSGKTSFEPTRLSTIDSAARLHKFITKVIRHENHSIDRTIGQTVWEKF